MYNKATRYIFAIIVIISVLCSMSSCYNKPPITYTYEELSTDLIRAEIINISVGKSDEVLKTLSVEECDYVIREISNMEFKRTLWIGDLPSHLENVLIFYYPSFNLQFYKSVIYKATDESETGVRSYYVDTDELEELIDNVLNNRIPLET